MFKWICHSCRAGNHNNCAGRKLPRKGYMGGSTCICKHKAADDETVLQKVRESIEIMIASSEVFTDELGVIVGYKIKTGALHHLIGYLDLAVPSNLPEAKP